MARKAPTMKRGTAEKPVGKKRWVFRSKFRGLSVYWKSAPNEHIVFKGANIPVKGEDGETRAIPMGLYETEDAKLAKHLDENVKECWLVEVIEPGAAPELDDKEADKE